MTNDLLPTLIKQTPKECPSQVTISVQVTAIISGDQRERDDADFGGKLGSLAGLAAWRVGCLEASPLKFLPNRKVRVSEPPTPLTRKKDIYFVRMTQP